MDLRKQERESVLWFETWERVKGQMAERLGNQAVNRKVAGLIQGKTLHPTYLGGNAITLNPTGYLLFCSIQRFHRHLGTYQAQGSTALLAGTPGFTPRHGAFDRCGSPQNSR